MKHKFNFNISIIITTIAMTSIVLSTAYIIVLMISAPSSEEVAAPFDRTKSDYVLMLLQCILGIVALILPNFLKRTISLEIPSSMTVMYIIFLYCAIYLGEVRSFYYEFPHWDTILHWFSGAMLGALGFSFINFFNKTDKIPVNLSPMFVASFAFAFAITMGVAWEIYEFLADEFLQTNMQKFATEGGELLMGRQALSDTMHDLIVDVSGAFAMSVVGYISIKYKKGWVETLLLKIRK